MRWLVWIAVAACGQSTSSPPPSPAPVAAPAEAASAAAPKAAPPASDHTISVRGAHACARTREGRVSCWGRYRSGDPVLRPTALPGFDSVVGIAVGELDVCAWRSDGHVLCSRLPDGSPEVIANLDHVDELAADGRVVCARHAGKVSCWAREYPSDALGPVTEAAGITDAVQIAVADDTACARRATGEVACWSHKPTHNGVPPAFGDAPSPVARARGAHAIAGGGRRFAAILASGEGAGWDVQAEPWTPPAGALTRVALGDKTVCAEAAGALRCFDAAGAAEMPALAGAIELSVADGLGCARMRDGHVRCWGYVDRLGVGEALSQPHPVEVVGIDDATAIAGDGAEATCVIRRTGRVACWGTRLTGKPRRDGPAYDLAPVDVGVDRATAIEMAGFTACAHTADQKLRCFGYRGGDKHWDQPTVVARHPAPVLHGKPMRWTGGWSEQSWVCVRQRRSGVSCTEETSERRGGSSKSHIAEYDSLTDVASMILPASENDAWFVLHGSGVVESQSDGEQWHRVMDGVGELVHVAPDEHGNAIECARKLGGAVSCWQGAEVARATDLGISDAIALVGTHDGADGRGCVLRRTGHVACWGTRELLGDGHSSILGPTEVPGLSL